MGVEDQSQAAAQPAGKSKPSPQGRRGRNFGPNRRGRGRRPLDRPSGMDPEQAAPADIETPSTPLPGLPPAGEIADPGVAPLRSDIEAQQMLPISEEIAAARTGEQTDAAQPSAPSEPPVMEQRRTEQRHAQVPSRPSAYSRPPGQRQPQTPERRPPPQPTPPKEFRPAQPLSVQEAIEDVNEIIETLQTTLDEMEEVLETLELAERQKDADEQEIESLRRSLRQLGRPRESGHREGGPRDAGQRERESGNRESGPREGENREGGPRDSGQREDGHRH